MILLITFLLSVSSLSLAFIILSRYCKNSNKQWIKAVSKRKFKRRTAVSFICEENTQIIKLKLQNESIEKIKKLEVIVSASTSLILTRIVELKIDSLTYVKKSIKTESSTNQYVMPKSLVTIVKHAAIMHNCHSYEVVEQCILNLTSDEENSIIKNIHAKFRTLGIV